jgi:hypothetical protein
MRPGRLPVDLHRAAAVPIHRRFSLSFAVCLILGPAIFLAILAYEGALAVNPAPFDDNPAHHHRDVTRDAPLRFCTYLDESNHIQVKKGSCSDSDMQGIHRQHKATMPGDFCVMRVSNETFDIVNCYDNKTSQMEQRSLLTSKDHDACSSAPVDDENLSCLPSGLCFGFGNDHKSKAVECPHNSENDNLLPHEIEPLPPRLLDRATPSEEEYPHTLADERKKRTSTSTCVSNFCDWVGIPGEIKCRCYAEDDKNSNTPPMSDEALKYTAPFECNLCLELGVPHKDIEHIERHCSTVAEQEDRVFKILVAALGGFILLSIICGICVEHQMHKRRTKPNAKVLTANRRPGKRNPWYPVMPPYDRMSERDLSLSSITTSQKDAPEINVISPPQSVFLERGFKIPVMPDVKSLKSRKGSINHSTAPSDANISTVDTDLPHYASVVETAEKKNASSHLLASELMQPVHRRKCSFCSSITSEIGSGSHNCISIKCNICMKRVSGDQAIDHAAICHVTTPNQSPKINHEN